MILAILILGSVLFLLTGRNPLQMVVRGVISLLSATWRVFWEELFSRPREILGIWSALLILVVVFVLVDAFAIFTFAVSEPNVIRTILACSLVLVLGAILVWKIRKRKKICQPLPRRRRRVRR